LGGRNANLVTDYRLGAIKVKTKSGQACSLFSLSSSVSGKKRKTHSSFFLFPPIETLPLGPEESKEFLGGASWIGGQSNQFWPVFRLMTGDSCARTFPTPDRPELLGFPSMIGLFWLDFHLLSCLCWAQG